MVIFSIFLIIVLFLCNRMDERNRDIRLLIIIIVLIFITASRTLSFYTDTVQYLWLYNRNRNISIGYLFNDFIHHNGKDPFYQLFTGILAHAGISFRLFLYIVSVFFYLSLFAVLKKFDKLPVVTIFCYISLSYVFFTMTGIRQTIAIAFCHLAFIFLYDKKYIRAILLVLAGALFHSSGLIFLLAFPLLRRKIGAIQIGIVLACLALTFFAPETVRYIIQTYSWTEDLAVYSETTTGLSISGFVIQLGIIVFSFFMNREYCLNDDEGRAFLNLALLGLAFQSFVIIIDNIFRVSMYFSWGGILLLSNTIAKSNIERDRKFAIVVICIFAYLYMFKTGYYFHFSLFGGI